MIETTTPYNFTLGACNGCTSTAAYDGFSISASEGRHPGERNILFTMKETYIAFYFIVDITNPLYVTIKHIDGAYEYFARWNMPMGAGIPICVYDYWVNKLVDYCKLIAKHL